MSWTNTPALVRAATLALAVSAWAATEARATTIDFSYSGAGGYSATGDFTYNAAGAPAVITESGAGATNTIQSFSISFFSPTHALLESGSSVVGGVSSDSFFRLVFNTATDVISTLDADVGGNYTYFLTNLRTPTGSTVPAGQTGFNLFNRNTANAALDTAPSLTARAVPEPSALALMATAMLSLLVLRRRMG